MSKKSWALAVTASIFFGILEATLITLLPSPWRDFRPVLVVSVLLVILNRPKAALLHAAIAGLIVDAFSGTGAFAFARFILITATVWIISDTVVTNRSIYATAALITTARLIDRIWIFVAGFAGNSLFAWNVQQEPFVSTLITLIWDIGTISIAFMLLAFFTRRFLTPVSRNTRFYE